MASSYVERGRHPGPGKEGRVYIGTDVHPRAYSSSVDAQRTSFGRAVAVLRSRDGSLRVGSTELLDAEGAVSQVLCAPGGVYVLTEREPSGRAVYDEATLTADWEEGPARCSAYESGGYRCTLDANHAQLRHEWHGKGYHP